jgi:membrane-bound lytic murein transglycosylase D
VQGDAVILVPRVDEATRLKNAAIADANLYTSGQDQAPNEPLLVPMIDENFSVEGKKRVFYRVVAGDNLPDIASVLGVTSAELGAWNDVDPESALQPRLVLAAWVAPKFNAKAANVRLLDETRLAVVTRGSQKHLDMVEARQGRERVAYVAKGKESFETIGKKFGLGPRDLSRINRMPADTVLTAGQQIVVYRVVDKDRSPRAKEQFKKAPHKTLPKATKTPTRTSDVSGEGNDAKEPAVVDSNSPKQSATSAGKQNTAKADAKADNSSPKAVVKAEISLPTIDQYKSSTKKTSEKRSAAEPTTQARRAAERPHNAAGPVTVPGKKK